MLEGSADPAERRGLLGETDQLAGLLRNMELRGRLQERTELHIARKVSVFPPEHFSSCKQYETARNVDDNH